MRELEIGEDVLARDGSRLGQVERIVVDEGGHRVTHLVVGGRAVPVELFHDGGRDGLAADLDRRSLRSQMDASEPPFAAPGEHWHAPAGYAVGSFLAVAGALIGQAPYRPPVTVDVRATGIHEITSGSTLWSGGERLGAVREVRLDDSGEIAGVLLDEPGFGGAGRLIPASRILRVVGDNVHTDLSPAEVEALPTA